MNVERFRFSLGQFECHVVSDGTFAYPYPARNDFINFFANAPRDQLQQALRRHNLDLDTWEQYVTPYPCLVINTGQYLVLVDTGAGSLAPTAGKLVSNLQAEGIKPKDIDKVILTHGHPDHIGGTLDREGTPVFPNARYVMRNGEWELWTSEPNLDTLQISDHGRELLVKVAQDNLLPLRNQIDLISHETEIVSGIRVFAAPGHTPGHMVVDVHTARNQLLYLSDTVLHPIHLEEPDWYSAVAINPHQVVAARRRILAMASNENVLTLVSHFPFPGLGHVLQKDERW